MDLEEWGAWGRKWRPLIAIFLHVVAVLIAAVALLGWSWTVAGVVIIAILSFILGYYIHSWSTPASSPATPSSRPLFRGTYNVDKLEWPFEVQVSKHDIKLSKVVHVGNPICPGCKGGATIDQEYTPLTGEIVTILSCPQAGVYGKKSCKRPREREIPIAKWKDLVARLIEGEIRNGRITPSLPM